MAENAKLYMRLTGPGGAPIDGECEIDGHVGEIELDSWRWNLGTNKENGDPEPSTFAFDKLMDKATPKMLRSLASLGKGTADPMKAVIQISDHGLRGTSGKPLFELTMTLERVFVLEYTVRLRVEEAGGAIEEDWVFDYETLRLDYRSAYHPGTSTVTLLRPPGSSTEAPSRRRRQIEALASEGAPDDIEKLWDHIVQGIDSFDTPLADLVKRIQMGKG